MQFLRCFDFLGIILVGAKKGTHPKKRRSIWPKTKRATEVFLGTVEQLEVRTLLTTTIFLDFGAGVGVGNTLSTTTGAFQNIFGPGLHNDGTGVNFVGEGFDPTDSLDYTPLKYDFNNDGVINNSDLTALADAVQLDMQRAMEPFDINVVIANSTSFAQMASAVAANAGDPTGQFDAYDIIMDATSDGKKSGKGGSISKSVEIYGIAAGDDLNAQEGNKQDEAAMVLPSTIVDDVDLTPGTAAYNQELAFRIASTATHEAFHTLGFVHTSGPLTTSGDVIRNGSNTRLDPTIVTRFDLHHDDTVMQPNNYLQLKNDPDIGLRDDNHDGIPDLAYVTGTGANDKISLVYNGNGIVGVTVSAYSNATYTKLIATESYTINLATDTDGTILIDGSINSDQIDVDARIPAIIRVRGGLGTDGEKTEDDSVIVHSAGLPVGNFIPAGTGAANLTIAGGATIQATEMDTFTVDGAPAVLTPGTATLVDDPANPGSKMLLVVGTTKNDQLSINLQSAGETVAVTLGKTVLGTFPVASVGRILAYGMAGNDTITVASTVTAPVELHGDAGNDTLRAGGGPATLYGGDGNDNLFAGAGNDLLFGEDGNDSLVGGAGNDVLSGGTGRDTLKGAGGRNVLIGGADEDKLSGTAGDNIFIAGTTDFDTNSLALTSIVNEWSSAADYSTRIAHLNGTTAGGLNAAVVLTEGPAATVHDDGKSKDVLTGGTGRDWFFARTQTATEDKISARVTSGSLAEELDEI